MSNSEWSQKETPIDPITTFIRKCVLDGFPSLVVLRFSGKVDWNVNGVWCRDLELKVTPPYASPIEGDVDASVKALWEYALRPLAFIQPVPYENLGGEESAVEAALAAIEALKVSVETNPYYSGHRAEVDGVVISAELFFKP